MVKGIYKITNNRSGEVYIGQSKDIESRKNTHFNELSQRKHHNIGMQNDYSSGDKFSFEILEKMPHASKADLYNKESYYIKKFNSFYEGYNQTPGGLMDQFKGKYKYGGGRLPVEKYHSISTDNKSTSVKEYTCLEINEKKPNTRNTKILIIVFASIAIISFIIYIENDSILIGSMGLAFTIAAIISSIYLKFESSKLNRINEKESVKNILNENSLNIEEKTINAFLSLNKKQKQVFCDVYKIQNTNEVILKFIDKHWTSNEKSTIESINKYWRSGENYDLYVVLNQIRKFKSNIYYSTISKTFPKSIAKKILIRDNFICQKCGKNLLEYEMEKEIIKNNEYVQLIKPLEKGGTITEDNLITACKTSCNTYYVSSKELMDIYENTPAPNPNQKLSRIERNGLSFKFPDNYLVAKIPNNCPECAVALAKDDGKCDILVEIAKDDIYYNSSSFDHIYMSYVKDLDGFFDIKQIDIDKLNKERQNIDNFKKSCFIATSNVERQSNKKGIVKSIIYFDFNQNGKTIRITLNSLLKDKYNCMNDLYVIANSLKFKK